MASHSRHFARARLGAASALVAVATLLCGASSMAAQEQGRIAGQVVDAETGRPLSTATVQVFAPDGATLVAGMLTDNTGRFRTQMLEPGTYSVQVDLIGFQSQIREGVPVGGGGTEIINFALGVAAVELEGLEVTASRTGRTSSEAGLLAVQQAAPVVTDGISAEQISRSPDSNAGDALARVTGVSIVNDKFVVVRGLGERYANTLLNGSELASPEPAKRVVPMDIFPASLLESVVTTKTATPDRPGDFAGGSVEIRTKEFPEQQVVEFSLSQGFNSLTTFEELPVFARNGLDWLAFDGAGRDMPTAEDREEFLEQVRNEWTPAPRTVYPNLGLGLSFGDQVGDFDRALGYVVSLDYGRSTSHTADDFFLFVIDPDSGSAATGNLSQRSTTTVDWGGVVNFAKRLGPNHTLTLKNLVTREAEEFVNFAEAFDPEIQGGFEQDTQRFQVRYVERTFLQSQLGGRHLFEPLLNSSIEWSGTYSRAMRDEPENRSIIYIRERGDRRLDSSVNSPFWFRFLDDDVYAGKLDWSLPLSLYRESDGLLKFGGLGRLKQRVFTSRVFDLEPTPNLPDGTAALALPPEQLLSPENAGRNVQLRTVAEAGLPYEADDQLLAGYAMLDLRPLSFLRLVGGVRVENWTLDVFPGTADAPSGPTTERRETDLLWSANATVELAEDFNFRTAAYRTLSRPDSRELTESTYSPVTGECTVTGNPNLNRALILNADARLEWYPGAGELVSVSGFYKDFDQPIVQIVRNSSFSCVGLPINAEQAINLGLEVEVRKNLGFLLESLQPVSLGGNFTFVEGDVDVDVGSGVSVNLPLQDQSRFLFNGNLLVDLPDRGFSGSILYNYFDNRVLRYGTSAGQTGIRVPDVVEQGRGTIDVKFSQRLGNAWKVSVSGKNLTNEPVREIQDTAFRGPVSVGYAPQGVSFSVGLSYAR